VSATSAGSVMSTGIMFMNIAPSRWSSGHGGA
jgi:hypothetical protein